MIIPSRGEEGFGIVALEGMACGCRIIAADAGGLPEAVNGLGKIFRMKDQAQLEYLLERDMEEPNQSNNSISEDMRKYLLDHKKEAVAIRYLHLFQ